MSGRLLANITAVSLQGRALLIEGPAGSGKSSLALALIDRGATLIGDDGVAITRDGGKLTASPPPNTAGLIEIRNVGIVEMPVCNAFLSLVLLLDPAAPRFPMHVTTRTIDGVAIPQLPFAAGDTVQAIRAEHALEQHGLPLPKPDKKA